MPKTIHQYPPKERKAVQAVIDKLIENRKAELAILERNLIQPLKDAISTAKDARKGMQTLDAMLYRNKKVSEHISKFFNRENTDAFSISRKPAGFLEEGGRAE